MTPHTFTVLAAHAIKETVCAATGGHYWRAWDRCPSLARCARCHKSYTAVRGRERTP